MSTLPLTNSQRALSLFTIATLLAGSGFAQNAAKNDAPVGETQKLETFNVTGSFIRTTTKEPIAPVAVVTEQQIRSTGATTPIEALRYLPAFNGNPGPTEFDSSGATGSTYVALRGLGASQTLTLIDGRPTTLFSNMQLVPVEAIERIEVLSDGAGIIYGSSAIGGAVNIILKKNYNGLTADIYGGAATRSPGDRATFQGSFVAGKDDGKTSVVVTGSYFKNRTIYARDRPNSAPADLRYLGGINGGSPTFSTVISSGGNPLILKSGVSTPTSLNDYITMDTNTFSSNQMFNFREFSPSAPGQLRTSIYSGIEHKIADQKLIIFGSFLYGKLQTHNALAPSGWALTSEPVKGGPAVGAFSTFGPYNLYTVAPVIGTSLGVGGILQDGNGDFVRNRVLEMGNRINEQYYNDFRYTAGLKGDIGADWHWEAAVTLEREEYRQFDSGVPDLKKLDAQIIAGNFNIFAPAFSKGTATIDGKVYNWDNAKAALASGITAQQTRRQSIRNDDVRLNGKVIDLPAGPLSIAGGYERRSGNNDYLPEAAYNSGGVLGLGRLLPTYSEFKRRSVYAEIKVPIISAKNKVPFIYDLSVGALARREAQTIYGINSVTNLWDNATFQKTNPSINLQYSVSENYKLRATWSNGYNAPTADTLFGANGGILTMIKDPLGFPTNVLTSIVVRGNRNLKPESSKAWSLGFVAAPKGLLKRLKFTADFYSVEVNGIIANNALAILGANAAGQGPGFVPGNAATINPNAPFASLINRSPNGRLNDTGTFVSFGVVTRGAVSTDYLNIASRKILGAEYSASYVLPTIDMGQFTFSLAANQFLKYDQATDPGQPATSFLGKYVSTAGNPISPGSVPRWKGNFATEWNWKGFSVNATINYIDKYMDDPLFVLSPKMRQFYDAGTPKSDPTYAAFLAAPEGVDPKLGGIHWTDPFVTVDLQASYRFTSQNTYLKGLKFTVGARNAFDKLAPYLFGAFEDNYDTHTVNNVGRFVYAQVRKDF